MEIILRTLQLIGDLDKLKEKSKISVRDVTFEVKFSSCGATIHPYVDPARIVTGLKIKHTIKSNLFP